MASSCDLNESTTSIYSDYSIDDLEKEYNKVIDLQDKEPAQIEELPEVKEELIRKYENEIEHLSSFQDIPLNQADALDLDYDGQCSYRETAIDRNENKIIGFKRNIALVNSDKEI
jgi:cytoplasmic iron level regulating protein YaaA (DUF328/UPF0246 family)